MSNTVTISVEELKCLRERLKEAISLIDSLGSGVQVSKPNPPKEPTQAERTRNYSDLIGTGQRYKKPKHLRKN